MASALTLSHIRVCPVRLNHSATSSGPHLSADVSLDVPILAPSPLSPILSTFQPEINRISLSV